MPRGIDERHILRYYVLENRYIDIGENVNAHIVE